MGFGFGIEVLGSVNNSSRIQGSKNTKSGTRIRIRNTDNSKDPVWIRKSEILIRIPEGQFNYGSGTVKHCQQL
jgi:hypothetical protein